MGFAVTVIPQSFAFNTLFHNCVQRQAYYEWVSPD
jgi:hypothetical protein